jgi:hydroxyacylglutathione hydrolase
VVVTAEELGKLIKTGQAPVVLDVRSGFEFKSGHIRGAIHAPLVSVLKTARAASNNKEDLLVLICEHGPRAQFAKAMLKWKGYKNLELLNGHMSQWRQSGRSVNKG